MSMQSQDSAMAQLNLINNAELFITPTQRLTDSTRSALPTVSDQSASLQLSISSKGNLKPIFLSKGFMNVQSLF